jgi:hypothetical protein
MLKWTVQSITMEMPLAGPCSVTAVRVDAITVTVLLKAAVVLFTKFVE